MNSTTKLIAFAGLAAVIVFVGILLGRSGKQAPPPPVTTPETSAHVQPTETTPVPIPPPALAASNPLAPLAVVTTNPPVAANLITNWEDKIEEILKLDSPDKEIAKQLLAVFPRFPAEGQIEAVQDISHFGDVA